MQVVIGEKSLLFKFSNKLDKDKINSIIQSVDENVKDESNILDFVEFAKKIAKPVKNFKFNREEMYEER